MTSHSTIPTLEQKILAAVDLINLQKKQIAELKNTNTALTTELSYWQNEIKELVEKLKSTT